MYLTNCLSVLLLASLANAATDASKYTVAFHFEGMGYRCLGGLISDQFAISVGECFADNWGKYYEVKVTAVVGAKDLSNVEGAVKTDVAEVFLPWFYAGRTQRHIHDFAIVKLKDKLNLESNNLVALKYPSPSSKFGDYSTVGSVAGYGVNYTKPGALKYEDVDVVPYMDCFQGKVHDDFASHVQFCIKRKEGGKCSSDRGSPYVDGDVLVGVQMTCVDDSPYELYKMVSGYSEHIPGAFIDQPGLYSRHYYP